MSEARVTNTTRQVSDLEESISYTSRIGQGAVHYSVFELLTKVLHILQAQNTNTLSLSARVEELSQSTDELAEIKARIAEVAGEAAILRTTLALNKEV